MTIPVINALTIDLEDYFHVSAFNQQVRKEDWDGYPLRVEQNTHHILDLLDEIRVKGTFFILGWVAERKTVLVREIQARGHEVACHGYGHDLIYRIGRSNFKRDIEMARKILEDICGEKIQGYRAPSFSITKDSLWALDALIEEGFAYDSSMYPIHHDLYGLPGMCPFPHEIHREGGAIKEFPLSTLRLDVFNKSIPIPIAGGGYLRFFPLWVIVKGIRKLNMKEGQPSVLYFHPWELDPDQPRIRCNWKSKFRHYYNIAGMEEKVKYLLESFRYAPMRTVLGI